MEYIKIEQSEVTKIEALQYELEARKEVINSILKGRYYINPTQFENYKEQYSDFREKYNSAKNEFSNKYFLTGKRWSLDFKSCILRVEN